MQLKNDMKINKYTQMNHLGLLCIRMSYLNYKIVNINVPVTSTF